MAATIKIKNSSTAGAAPTSSDLVQGELAVNVTDKRLFTENASGTVVELGTNPSVPVTFPDGSASAPSLTNDGDTNTGLFFPAADTVGIATGGSERARVDSSGNLGLGVTPSAWSLIKAFQLPSGVYLGSYTGSATPNLYLGANNYFNGTNFIYSGSYAATKYEQTQGAHQWYNAASGTAGNTISFTQAMTLDASGNLGVGTTSPSGRLHVEWSANNATAGMYLRNTSNGSSAYAGVYIGNDSSATDAFIGSLGSANTAYGGARSLLIGTNPSAPVVFMTATTERARIDSSGNLLVGKTSAGNGTVGFQVSSTGVSAFTNSDSTSGTNTLQVYSTGASAYRFYVGMNGTISATSTTITGISDQRLKENIRDLDDGLEKVMALQPRKFDWKEGKGAGTKDARGFIAQEFETVFPDMIEQWLDEAPEGEEPYKAVNANLVPTLVKAIQEQQAILTALTARIEALEQA